jgi:hypothetical protein
MEPNQETLLVQHLDKLQECHHRPLARLVVSRVDVFTLLSPWLGVVLLAAS